jgi:hypothetical protein
MLLYEYYRNQETSQEIYDLLLREAKVAVVPGLKQWFEKVPKVIFE